MNLQKQSQGTKDPNVVMSQNIWSTLRMAISLMGKPEFYQHCDNKDIEALNSAFGMSSTSWWLSYHVKSKECLRDKVSSKFPQYFQSEQCRDGDFYPRFTEEFLKGDEDSRDDGFQNADIEMSSDSNGCDINMLDRGRVTAYRVGGLSDDKYSRRSDFITSKNVFENELSGKVEDGCIDEGNVFMNVDENREKCDPGGIMCECYLTESNNSHKTEREKNELGNDCVSKNGNINSIKASVYDCKNVVECVDTKIVCECHNKKEIGGKQIYDILYTNEKIQNKEEAVNININEVEHLSLKLHSENYAEKMIPTKHCIQVDSLPGVLKMIFDWNRYYTKVIIFHTIVKLICSWSLHPLSKQ